MWSPGPKILIRIGPPLLETVPGTYRYSAASGYDQLVIIVVCSTYNNYGFVCTLEIWSFFDWFILLWQLWGNSKNSRWPLDAILDNFDFVDSRIILYIESINFMTVPNVTLYRKINLHVANITMNILPIVSSFCQIMKDKPLFYSGFTRTSNVCILCMSRSGFRSNNNHCCS